MRRAVLTRGGAVLLTGAVIAVAAGCGGSDNSSSDSKATAVSGSSGGGQMTFNTWGGAYQEAQQKAIVGPFQQSAGVKVNVTQPIDYAKLKSMVTTGNVVWDVADVEPYVSRRGCKEGWLEKLDYKVVDPSGFLSTMPRTACSVPNGAFGLTMAYRSDKWSASNHPKTWADFFDTKKFPGKRSFPKYAESGILEAALLADGVPKDKLYPIDAARAFRKLDTVKKDIVFWESGDQSEQLMQSGEVTLCACWATRMYDAQANQDTPIAIEWQDAIYGWDDFVVPKGAKNLKRAMEFINYGTHPTQEIAMTKYTPWGPSRTKAAAATDATTRAWVPTTPEHAKIGVPINYDYWGDNAPKLDEQFAQWLLT
jgi:putative spermidine/putrescine transport system substrate-binding protein